MTGAREWLLHRIGGLLVVPAAVMLLRYFLKHGDMGYEAFVAYVEQAQVRVALTAALLGLCAHAGLGLRAVVTDYLNERMTGTALYSGLAQTLAYATLLAYLAWGAAVVWS